MEAWSTGSAVAILSRSLGLRPTASVLANVASAMHRGMPFEHLPAPRDRREMLSRRQCAPAIVMYKALRRRLGEERALLLTSEVVLAGTIHFLRFAIGPLSRAELLALSPTEREALFHRIGERFFNATVRWDEVSEERLRLTVTHCLFPELCEQGGAPEVAPLLCRGDATYFGQVLGTVELVRPHTLADGAEECPFELSWK